MINRRYLRTSVMQTLYSLQMDWNVSLDLAIGLFEDDLRDKAFAIGEGNEWTAARMAEAEAAFDLLRQQPAEERRATFFPEAVRVLAQKALLQTASASRQDVVRRRKQLTANFEAAYEYYIRILMLAPMLSEHVLQEEREMQARYIKPEPATAAQLRLTRNPYLQAISASPVLHEIATRRGYTWEDQHSWMRRLYKEGLKTNPYYQEYLAAETDTDEDHLRMMRWMLRVFLVNSPIVTELYEEENFAYGEIRQATLHLLQDSIKDWQRLGYDKPLPIHLQGEDWADASQFQLTLFDKTLERRQDLLTRLSTTATNWDIRRIAIIDSILIQMGLTEMIEFSTIPIKVSLNEYLDVAKTYSTPQSQAFINGVMDAMITKLTEEKIIRKTGKGMI